VTDEGVGDGKLRPAGFTDTSSRKLEDKQYTDAMTATRTLLAAVAAVAAVGSANAACTDYVNLKKTKPGVACRAAVDWCALLSALPLLPPPAAGRPPPPPA